MGNKKAPPAGFEPVFRFFETCAITCKNMI
nr:MAG TPA: hypothetical protein [Caudoviricetes sp.]